MSTKTKAKAAPAAAAKKAPIKAPVKTAAKGGKPAAVDFYSSHEHLFPSKARVHGVGKAIAPKRDLSRYVRWPVYIRLQRQKSILKKRLKVPPAINQFTKTLDKNQASNLFRLLSHYRPETVEEKKKRLLSAAASEVKGKDTTVKTGAKPMFVKFGLNHIATLIESKKAKLVVILMMSIQLN